MADVRALLAAERQSRRISHPHLTYTKSGLLTCNICHLNVKSEQLWEGHLRSLNHRKNATKPQESGPKTLKRKIEDVEISPVEDRSYELDGRKKPKPPPENASQISTIESVSMSQPPEIRITDETLPPANKQTVSATIREILPASTATTKMPMAPLPPVNEDEWAAFERDIAPLAQSDYSSAVISAAPVSAEELAAQAEAQKRTSRETEADDEKEDESRRLEEEFDVMEEMEARVKKLRQQREALRLSSRGNIDQGEVPRLESTIERDVTEFDMTAREGEDEDDEDDIEDDWYS